MLLIPGNAGAAEVRLFNVPSADSGLEHIVAGPDGALWFTERKAGRVGRITAAGQITEYPIPNDASGLEDTGPDEIVSSGGALWFLTDIGSSVYRITTAGIASRIYYDELYPASALSPSDDGGVWLMESYGDGHEEDDDALIRLAPDGSSGVRYRATYSGDSDVIALAPDGAAWFNDGGSYLKRVTDAGEGLNVPLPQPEASIGEVTAIAFAADGTPFYTEFWPGGLFGTGACCGQIGWVSGGSGHLVPIGSQKTGQGFLPHAMVRGPEGDLWFAFSAAYSEGYAGIGRIDPGTGQVELGNLSPYNATDIAFGADGALWFVDQGANQIGRIADPASMLSVPSSPAPPSPPATPPTKPGSSGHAHVRLRLASHRVRHGRLSVSLSCGAGAACAGKVRLGARGRELGLGGRKARRDIAIAGHPYKLAAGKAKTISLRLSRKALRALHHHPLRVTAKVTVNGGKATTKTIKLRRG